MQELLDWIIANWPFLTVSTILFAAIVAVIVTFIVEEAKLKKNRNLVFEQNNSVRIYFIDLPHNTVKYFNAIDIGNTKTISVTAFYAQFPTKEQRKVIDWVKKLAYEEENENNSLLEVPVTISKSNKQAFTILQVDHIDRENGTLRVYSFLLNFFSVDRKGNKESNEKRISSLEEYVTAIAPNAKKRKGVTICFRFRYKRNAEARENIDRLVMEQIKTSLYPALMGKRLIVAPSENEILLVDPNIGESQRAMALAREGMNYISSYLALNGYLSEIDCRTGVMLHRDENLSPEELLEHARDAAKFVYDTDETIFFYDKGKDVMRSLSDSSYRSEIERIINDRKIVYSFRAIYSTTDEEVIGYFTKADPTDTYFETMEDVKNYASRSGDSDNLFSTLFRRTLPIFIHERQDEKQILFFPVRAEDLSYMLRIVSKSLRAREANLVFYFNESDLRNHVNFASPESFLDQLVHIKAKGFSVGLTIDEQELGLPDTVYQVFDYFATSFSLPVTTGMDMDDRVRVLLHALPERLLRYEKPIIATDIGSWAAISLIANSGLTLLSSNLISGYEEMIEPIAPKTLKKLKDATK